MRKYLNNYGIALFAIVGLVTVLVIFTNVGKKAMESDAASLQQTVAFSLVGSWKGTNGEVIMSVVPSGGYLYAAGASDGLYIFNTSNYAMVTNLSFTNEGTNSYINNIVIQNFSNQVYAIVSFSALGDRSGFYVLNVTDPTNIYSTNFYSWNGNLLQDFSVEIIEGKLYLFAAEKDIGIQPYKIQFDTNTLVPDNSLKVNTRNLMDIDVYGEIGYLAAKENGVYALQLAYPGFIITKMATALSSANAVSLSKNILAVADRMIGILLYDVSNPEKPKLLTKYDTSGDAFDVIMDSNTIYVADGINGVLKLTRIMPFDFRLDKQFNDGSIAYRIFLDKTNGLVYAALGKDGFCVLK